MPLRGGSRSIPDKNLKSIAGKPLFAWALAQTLASGCFDEVCVSSDREEIRARARTWFGEAVTVLDRSEASATDEASSESVMLEVAERVGFDVMALVQATSPLTRAEDFMAAKRRFGDDELDSLVTAVPSRRFVWSGTGKPLNYSPAQRPRRQEMAPSYVENGAFYFTRRAVLLEHRCRLGGRIGVHPMAVESLHEVDEPEDWATMERLLERRRSYAHLQHLRVLVVDVDGTLTDAGMYYHATGEYLKKFDTRDAHGMRRLHEAGIRVCVMTAERSAAVDARMDKLGFCHYCSGVEDKRSLLEQRLAQWQVDASEVGFVGDDLGDLAAMQAVGFSACPADAVAEIKEVAGYICRAPGGHGAVREVCDLIARRSSAGRGCVRG